MYSAHQLIAIFSQIDDFCKQFDQYSQHYFLPESNKVHRGPDCSLAMSEIMTILILFQNTGFRQFKTFYQGLLSIYWIGYFPNLPSYQRFVALIKRATLPMTLFAQLNAGKHTGIYYIDSSCLPVCLLNRSKQHKTFASIAKYGRTSVGWFFGLKLHIVINHLGQLVAFKITKAHHFDSSQALSLLNPLQGFAFGDKGYLGQKLFDTLLQKGLKLITRKRKNMKAPTLTQNEQKLLNQRGLIETVIGHLKFHYQLWHTRHRSICNAITHLVAALAAYTLQPLTVSTIKMLAIKP